MSRAAPGQLSFNAGIFSPRLDGRVDIDQYRAACRVMQNFVPLVAGGAEKRSGTRYVAEVKDSTDFTIVVGFEFSTTQAYILELGDQYMRVYKDGAVVLSGMSPYEVATPWATADLDALYFAQSADVLYVAHPSYAPYKISRTADDAWTVTAISFDWVPFDPENVTATNGMAASAATGTSIKLTSSAGVFTSAMVGTYVKLREVIPSHHGIWVAEDNLDGYSGTALAVGGTVYFDENVYELLDKQTFSVTGTSAPIHQDGARTDGKYIWLYRHSGAGYAVITGFTDAYRVTADVVKRLPDSVAYADGTITNITQASPAVVSQTSHGLQTGDRVYIQDVVGMTEVNQRAFTVTKIDANSYYLDDEDSSAYTAYSSGGIAVKVTPRYAIGAWSDANGYPRAVSFFEDRLAWAGSSNSPQTIWLSRTGDYENHRQSDEDESALLFTLNSDDVNVIEWISPTDVLAIGTAGSENTLSASSPTEALTAGNVRAPRVGTRGSKAAVQPVRVGQQVLYVQRSGRKLLELVFDFDTDGFQSVNLARFADTVPEPGIRRMAQQKEPNRVIWMVLDDGQLVGLTYEREEQVVGWHQHPLGGTDVVVEAVATIPHPDGDQDQVWLVVSRTIDGATVRYVEYIEKPWLETYDQEDAFFVDCGLTYDSTPATTITGLAHLEGETVAVLADGAVHPDAVVSSGQITLDRSASVVQVGLSYNADLQTMRIEAGGREGTAQAKLKRLHKLAVRFYQLGAAFQYGTDFTTMDQRELRTAADDLDAPVPLYDGDVLNLAMPGTWETDGSVAIRHNLPLPCTVLGVFPILETNEGR